MLRSCNSDS